MAFKRIIRDVIFLFIAFNLIRTQQLILAFYGLIIGFFTVYFYVGSKR